MKKFTFLIILMVAGYLALYSQPDPPTNVSATPLAITPGSSSSLNATSPGNTINWYIVATGGTAIGTSNSAEDFVVLPSATTTYYAESESSGSTSNLQIATSHNYGANGLFFSVTPSGTDCVIDGFPFIGNITGTFSVSVYYRQGEYSGFETNSGAWTHLGDYSTFSDGLVDGFVDITNLTVPSNTKYSFYLYCPSSIFLIKSSAMTVSDDRIAVTAGSNLNGFFTGYVYTNMSFRGSVRYMDGGTWVSTSRTPVTVTVGLNPPTGVTATPSSIYPGQTSNLNATSAGNNINWYTVATGGTALSTSASGVDFPESPTVTTTYYAEAEAPSITGNLQIATSHDYGAKGLFFSVTPSGTDCVIDGFPFIRNTTGTFTVSVYYRQGEYSGFETNSGAWTHLGDYSTFADGLIEGFVDITDLTVPANTKYSFYLYCPSPIFLIKSSAMTVSDDRIAVTAGSNINSFFSGYVYTNMSFRGSVRYVKEVGSVSLSRTPVTVTLLSDMVWNGSVNSDWNNGSNWNSGIVPSEGINVTIPDIANDPVIDWLGGICNDLSIESGASLQVNGGSLINYGTVTNNGSFSINVPLSTDLWKLIGIPVADATADIFMGSYLQNYTEASDTWNEIVEPTTPLVPEKGYALWMQSKVGLFTYTGTPNTGDFSMDYTYTPTGNPLHYGFNLMGNPYPSYIDWDQLNETYGAVYHYDGYSYTSWNGTGTGYSFIEPGEGFLIAPGTSGTLNLTNASRFNLLPVKSSAQAENTVVLKVGNEIYTDELYIVFNQDAGSGFDLQFDAWKIMTQEENISQVYSIMDDKKLSIDQQPATSSIPVGFYCSQSGNYTFSIGESTFDGPVYLEDTKTGTIHDLRSASYTFLYELGENDNRFILHFTPMGISNMERSQPFSIYASGNTIYISADEVQNRMQIHIYDLTGQAIAATTVQDASNAELDVACHKGIYLVTVLSDNTTYTQKIYLK